VLGLSTAGVQRVVVDASGNVGIGTASPARRLDVQGAGSGETYQLRLGATSTNSYDIGRSTTDGYLRLYGNQAAAYGYIFDGAGGERARIDYNGNLLVGTTDAAFNSGSGFKMGVGSNPVLGVVGASSSNGDITYRLYSTGAAAYRFYVGMGGTVYATSTTISGISDQRLKENVRELDDGLASVMALKPRKFDWKPGKGKDIKDDRGFIAQEFEQVFPDMIDTWQDPAPEGEEPYKSVNANLIPTLVKAIQEQQEIIEKLEARLAALESK
jgi:hypothetical protein